MSVRNRVFERLSTLAKLCAVEHVDPNWLVADLLQHSSEYGVHGTELTLATGKYYRGLIAGKPEVIYQVNFGEMARLFLYARRHEMAIEGERHAWTLPVAISSSFLDKLSVAVTDERPAGQKAQDAYLIDALTGCATRTGLVKQLEAMLSDSKSFRPFALHLLDVDDFKQVNDTYGHLAGDRLLCRITDAVSKLLGPDDLFARFGGDEFCVLQSSVQSASSARQMATDIGREVNLIEFDEAPAHHATASVGLCIVETPDKTVSQILRDADLAMYQAKRSGKNAFRIFDADLGKKVERRFELNRLLKAPEVVDGLYVVFQPIYDLSSGRIVKAESLMRWRRASEFSIGPEKLIRQSVLNGSYRLLRRRMLELVIAELKRFIDLGVDPVPVSLNLTVRDVVDAGFQTFLLQELDKARVPRSLLSVEVTEHEQFEDLPNAVESVRRLRRAGISIGLDDFGAGYASFNWLGELPVNELKIDRKLTRYEAHDLPKAAILRGICGIAKELGISLVAEGCESAGQIGRLVEAGCQFGQGYHLCRPVGPAVLREVLRRSPGGSGKKEVSFVGDT